MSPAPFMESKEYSRTRERTQRQITPMSLLVLPRWILRLIPRSVRRFPRAIHLTVEWQWRWLRRRTVLHNINTLRPIRAPTGRLITAMVLIWSRSGNYRHTRICILCRLILDRGVLARIRTPKWYGINQPVHRTFWAMLPPLRCRRLHGRWDHHWSPAISIDLIE